MQKVIAAAIKHAASLPQLGDVVKTVGTHSVEYDGGHRLSEVEFPNEQPQPGDIVTSVHLDIELDEEQIRVSVAHGRSDAHARGPLSLKPELKRAERINNIGKIVAFIQAE